MGEWNQETTTTCPPKVTTTSVPETTSTIPVTTTTVKQEETTTSVPQETTTSVPEETTTTVKQTTTTEQETTSTTQVGSAISQRTVTTVGATPNQLPFTGGSSVGLGVGGMSILIIGAAILAAFRRKSLV